MRRLTGRVEALCEGVRAGDCAVRVAASETFSHDKTATAWVPDLERMKTSSAEKTWGRKPLSR